MKRDANGRFLPKSATVAPVAKKVVAPVEQKPVETDPVKMIKPLAKLLVGVVGTGVATAVEKELFAKYRTSGVYQANKANLCALYTQLGMTEMAELVAADMIGE